MKRNRLNIPILKVTLAVLIVFASIYSGNNEARAFAPPPGDLSLGIVYYCDDAERDGAQRFFELFEDDGRFAEVSVINGGLLIPSAQELSSFDCVIAYTNDGRSCPPDREAVMTQASESLAGYVNLGGGLVILSFSFSLSESLGLGPAIFAPGLSPFQQVQAGNGMAGPVDIEGASSTPPACGRILSEVEPFSTNLNNVVALSQGASLCASYENGEEFLSVNQKGNVIGVNTFPSNEDSFDTDSYGRLLTNAAIEACSFNESTAIPTLSEWALLAMAFVLGAIGILAVRRRNSAAKG